MKNTLKLALLIIFAVLALSLFSCSEKEVVISYGENGEYLGFFDIEEDYNAEKAEADGCLVIDLIQGKNEHGATVNKESKTAGYENWQSFLCRAEAGEDAFLRVAHFIDGVGYYHDLYYLDGKYTIFDFNEYGVSKGATFRYLRRLDGYAGSASDRKESYFYVLTDSTELTYDDVVWSIFSSNPSTVTKIPFEWLGFMIYFE